MCMGDWERLGELGSATTASLAGRTARCTTGCAAGSSGFSGQQRRRRSLVGWRNTTGCAAGDFISAHSALGSYLKYKSQQSLLLMLSLTRVLFPLLVLLPASITDMSVPLLIEPAAASVSPQRPAAHGPVQHHTAHVPAAVPLSQCMFLTTPYRARYNQAVLHPEQDRILTVHESARLLGFLDCYRFCGTVK
ncbi:uncharacterized protein LOC126609340 [Malus sylvestris]|uniref:uncharacterized protein LOC126609340 n=1 Tax=Malus sylvestris TaxID=3752 RepID=UPI0021AC53E8|nr:uncharacterized protein LOC126609340 [Malus sylvestris]